ncbi:MAG: glycoside hydrolase family 3 N-terminal domain-containing protein, partial [Streptosporangiaceae bacterium]
PAAAGSAGAVRAVSPAIGLRPGAVSPSAAGLAAARAAVGKLSLTQLAGQRVIYSYSGLTPPAGLLGLISHGEVAGVIFFADNIGPNFASAVRELDRANAASTNPVRHPLLLMTDQEGGLVRRLPGAPALSERQIGKSAHPWAQATQAGASAAVNLRHYGLNVNLAPVLGVYRHPGNFLDQYQRSYSMRAAQAAKLGSLFITAQQHGGVAATAKHFPGLGAATAYQNTDLRPVTLRLSLSQLRGIDENPYPAAIAARVKLVMVSWATYPALDPRHPAGLSPAVVGGQLRQRLGFAGVTITDALEAGALGPFGTIAHRATLAAHAGMDLLLCSAGNYREGVAAMNSLRYDYEHGRLGKQAFTAAAERVIALRATLPGS